MDFESSQRSKARREIMNRLYFVSATVSNSYQESSLAGHFFQISTETVNDYKWSRKSKFLSPLLMQRQGPTQSLKPASILGLAHEHFHKPGEKKERNSLSEDKNQGNLTHRVHKEKRGSPQKQGFPRMKKGGRENLSHRIWWWGITTAQTASE